MQIKRLVAMGDPVHLQEAGACHAQALVQVTLCIHSHVNVSVITLWCRNVQSPRSVIGKELRVTLQWWREVLDLQIKERRDWDTKREPPMHLFCDARSTPPRVAAVLCRYDNFIFLRILLSPLRCYCRPGKMEFADFEPTVEVMNSFKKRGDNQILSLELLSIALGD